MRLSPLWLLLLLLTGIVLLTSAEVQGQSQRREEFRLDISLSDVNRPSTAMAKKVLSKAYEQLGIKLNFIATPAVRAVSMWNAGRLDAVSAKVIDTGLPRGKSPVELAASINGTLYVCSIPSLPDGSIEPGGIGAQTRQTMKNLKQSVEAAGATMDDVVQVQVFLSDGDQRAVLSFDFVPRDATRRGRVSFRRTDEVPGNYSIEVIGHEDP